MATLQGGPTLRHPAHRPRRLPGPAQLLDRLPARAGGGHRSHHRADGGRRGLPLLSRNRRARRSDRDAGPHRRALHLDGGPGRPAAPRRRRLRRRTAHVDGPASRPFRPGGPRRAPLLFPLLRSHHLPRGVGAPERWRVQGRPHSDTRRTRRLDGLRAPHRRYDGARDARRPRGRPPKAFICGSSPFVEAAAATLIEVGVSFDAIRTERFGPSGS